jgi:fido (protein-threonine AMPylation protein)/biotin operon repressor
MTNFEEYIRQGEPDRVAKSGIWQTAIGLQQVDGLTPSSYLIETAKQNIEGDITIEEAKQLVDSYYKSSAVRLDADDRTEEADKVSVRIAEVLAEKTFSFSPVEYIGIHRRLFSGLYKHAGKIRDYNITKQEWVLGGETVYYSSAPLIRETLEYDFREEKNFVYKGLTQQQVVEHITRFISGIWQIHPFGEGNTRATAVFAIKYLRTFGFAVDNEPFAEHSWYFRNALVRANYSNSAQGIHATTKYLDRFFGNLLFGENHALQNRELHIDWKENRVSGATEPDTVNDTLLELVKANPSITAEELRVKLNVSIATVKRRIKALKEAGRIERIGSDKTGHWIAKSDK